MGNQDGTSDMVLHCLAHPAFQAVLKMLQQPLTERIEKLEKLNYELTKEVSELKQSRNSTKEITQLPQEISPSRKNEQDAEDAERQYNLVITGFPEMENEELKKNLTEFFEAKFNKRSIPFECIRIGRQGPNKEETASLRPRPIKVKFDSIWDKRLIYSNKVQSLQNTGIYINEDLNVANIKKAYIARKLKRDKKIYQTFTSQGHIYIKETEFAEPTILTDGTINRISTPTSPEFKPSPSTPKEQEEQDITDETLIQELIQETEKCKLKKQFKQIHNNES